MEKFINRHEAGRILADQLKEYLHHPEAIILALPRGGVPVAYEIAKILSLPLDVFLVRKLGVPWHEELAFGAIASGGEIIFNTDILDTLQLSKDIIHTVIEKEKKELLRREAMYRSDIAFPNLENKIIILVDDGIATGATMRAAIKVLSKKHPSRLVIAVPVAAYSTYQEMRALVDEVVCPLQPLNFCAVGLWYEDFTQTTDREVAELLTETQKPLPSP